MKPLGGSSPTSVPFTTEAAVSTGRPAIVAPLISTRQSDICSAAGTPLPDTSPIANARRSGVTR